MKYHVFNFESAQMKNQHINTYETIQ